jgi:starvation-inducible DNA-binding protein
VTGPRFRELHLIFEEQHNELWLATDLVAERIRALGEYAPAAYREFTTLRSIAEPLGTPSAESMVGELLYGHEAVVRTAREVFALAEPAADQVTMDLLTQRRWCMRRPRGCCGVSLHGFAIVGGGWH